MDELSPLPRSLDPLPDEVLPGYLLRLAHRLDRTPARILQLTGLAGRQAGFPCRSSYEPMIGLDEQARAVFTAVTRLTGTEADSLCLQSLAARYPFPSSLAGSRKLTLRTGMWVFATATRYCPRCLAGDGTAVQQAHGGPWQRSWRLPVVFACPRHRRFLEHLCPVCQRPALGTSAGAGRIPLLQSLKVGGLHPAQCRSSTFTGTAGIVKGTVSVCGARLDTPCAPAHTLPGSLLALQRRLTGLLAPGGPAQVTSAGMPATAAEYFTDLRWLVHLIGMSWPRAACLAPSAEISDMIDRHVTRQRQRKATASAPGQATGAEAFTRPLDPLISAGMLAIAEQILASGDTAETRRHLQDLLSGPSSSSQLVTFCQGWRKRYLDTCTDTRARPQNGLLPSQGFEEAITPLARVYRRQGRASRRAPELHGRLGPQHIPQRLPDQRARRHLSRFDDIPPAAVRETAAIRLVQMTRGGSMGDAAHYLGMPTGINPRDGHRIPKGSGMLRWARSRPDPGEFDHAVHAIASELERSAVLIDYQHRRAILHDWSIDPATWQEIAEDSGFPARQWPATDRERQYASIHVWAEITQSDHRYAPHPIRDQQPPEIQQAWRTRCRPGNWPASPHEPLTRFTSPAYLALQKTLNAYAAQLATDIDRNSTDDLIQVIHHSETIATSSFPPS